MASSTNRRSFLSPASGGTSHTPIRRSFRGNPPPDALFRQRPTPEPIPAGKVNVLREAVIAAQERRMRRRVAVRSMYTFAIVRALAQRTGPIEAHIIDISENGIALEADSLVPVGDSVTVEFRIAGVGRLRHEEWPEFAVAGIVVRHDNLDDFPNGPYRFAIKLVQMPTMTQAHIARYVATQV